MQNSITCRSRQDGLHGCATVIAFALLIVFCYTAYRLIRMHKFSTGHKLRHLMAAELIVLVPVTIVQFYNFPYDIIPICSSFAVFIIILVWYPARFLRLRTEDASGLFEHIDNAVVILDRRMVIWMPMSVRKRYFRSL